MRKITLLLVGTALMIATSAMALTLEAGYVLNNSPFWTWMATTPGTKANFSLTLENAAYESDFGLFSVTGTLQNPSKINEFLIFDKFSEPNFNNSKTIYFNNKGEISLNGKNHWTAFDKEFGFFFGVYTGGLFDFKKDYTFYSYNSLNTQDAGIDHIQTAYNSSNNSVMIYLDDQLVATGRDNDFNDMVVKGNHLIPVDSVPVPEPGTMVLLGFGLFGLAIFGKRRMNKDA